jgi:peptidoglycan/LPS O-acetylase OafA/YrhL
MWCSLAAKDDMSALPRAGAVSNRLSWPAFKDAHGRTEPAAPHDDKVRFTSLDCCRGIAAMAVALLHLVVYSHFSDIAFVRHSWIFVDFFFVLSGFVITHAYFEDLQSHHRVVYFAIRRFGRLWPLHMAVLSVFVVFELVKLIFVQAHLAAPQPLFSEETGTSIWELVQNVFLVQSLGMNDTNTWNAPAWSISTELWAYATFAAVCMLPRRRLVAIAAILIALISAAIVMRYSSHYMATTFDFGMPRCLYGFYVGHLVYRFWSTKTVRLAHPGAAEFAAMALIVVFVSLVQSDIWSLSAPLMFGVAIWVFAFEAGPITALMRNRVGQTLGAWSYSIYMVHVFIVLMFEKIASLVSRLTGAPVKVQMAYVPIDGLENFIYFGNKWAMDVLVIAYFGLVLCAASLTYRIVEQPGRRFFNRLARTHFEDTGMRT